MDQLCEGQLRPKAHEGLATTSRPPQQEHHVYVLQMALHEGKDRTRALRVTVVSHLRYRWSAQL